MRSLAARPVPFVACAVLSVAWSVSALAADGEAMRTEHDLLGEKQVPASAYYGVQTARALENFQLSGTRLSDYPQLVRALAMVKLAAARANHDVGAMKDEPFRGIEKACLAIMAGRYHDQFRVDVFQGGAGTSTNMNANEVIANVGLELLGYPKGSYDRIEPHDDVNMSQSTNDAYPTALKVAMILENSPLVAEVEALARAFRAKGDEFAGILKMGRTETQDAVPMTLGQEFHAFASALDVEVAELRRAETALYAVNMGGTAIGTGLNAPPGYARKCVRELAKITGRKLALAPDLIAATSDLQGFVAYSGALRSLAAKLVKISTDLMFLSSGPRTGINEISLPALQPGSSIMPGKVNPVVPEVVAQVGFAVIGNDVTVSLAQQGGLLQLNAYEPVAAASILESQRLLTRVVSLMRTKCVDGIRGNAEVNREHFERSVGIVTALNPVLGYEKTTALAAEAMRSGRNVLDLVREQKLLSEERIDALMDVKALTGQR